eukprot:8669311-Pyramimonas_sp.AAC.1
MAAKRAATWEGTASQSNATHTACPTQCNAMHVHNFCASATQNNTIPLSTEIQHAMWATRRNAMAFSAADAWDRFFKAH